MDTERRLERYRGADGWPTDEALAAMLDNQQGAVFAVRRALPVLSAAVEAAAGRLESSSGRLVYAGAGASGRLAVQDGVELFPTFGWPHDRLLYLIAGGERALVRSIEGAEDDGDAAREAIAAHALGPEDVAIGVAASGATAYTCAALEASGGCGALTIGIANNAAAPLFAVVDHPIHLASGPEFLAGSTRMTAGTAQKIALNLFSTQLMTALGRVHDGLMVNLQPTNAKLVARGRRMVETITGCSADEAAAALATAEGDVRLAVLVADGHDLATARALLDQAGGRLRRARAIPTEKGHG